MLWRKRCKRRLLNPVAGFLLALFWIEMIHQISPLGGILGLFTKVEAAQVTLDAAVSTSAAEHPALGSQTVFTSDQVGYRFYVDSTGTCVYTKTTNGGVGWGTAVIIDSQTDCFGVTVWYDRWTPGDGGNYIHILTADPGNGDLWYNRLDTTTDTRLLNAAPISVVVNTAQGGSLAAGANIGTITKGTDGTLYMAMNDNTDSYVVQCTANCDLATGWTETGTNPMDLQPDFTMLLPLSGGDILLINRDASADDMRSKVWDDSLGSWSGAWTNIDNNTIESTGYDPAYTAAVNIITGDIFLAHIDYSTSGTVGGNNDDIRTHKYSSGVWSNGADVITNSTLGLTQVALGIDANTSDVYVTYSARTTAATATTGNVYWKTGSSAIAAWGAQQGPVNTGADDIYGVDINAFNYDRLFVSWYGVTPDDIFGDTIINLVPPTQVSVSGVQATEARASTANFYVGGKFVIAENAASRNVTQISINETGTVNAATALDNIKLFYDLDTSAPYNCVSESYGGSESQFGATDIDGFSATNGSATFTGSVTISPTQAMCVYAVLDVLKSASGGVTLEIEISDPGTDVLVSGGVTAIPATPQPINGETTIKFETDFKVQRGVSTITGNNLTIIAGVDYEAPSSSSSAFIRITNTGHTGASRDSGGGTSNSDDTTVYITNPENITSNITFQRGTGAVSNTRVSWEIVEYKGVAGGENEIIVRRHVPISYISANTAVSGTAVSSVVDDADVAVFITGQFNPNTAAASYHLGASTAAWNAGTNQAVLTRGAGGNVSIASVAVVEFTGSNWKVQRVEHTYSLAGTTQTEVITAVNSLSRTFIHVQKRLPSSSHANFGHEVWLSGVGQVSFLLDAAAVTPASHRSVAWVIENTQTLGTPMDVTRSNGTFTNTGAAPQSNNLSIGKTLSDISIASLFVNNRSDTITNTWPEPILGARLISNSQYELWRSDTGANIAYRTEVVEWPTAARKINQEAFRLYVDNDAVTPTDPWPLGGTNLGESAEMTAQDGPVQPGELVRIRMSLAVSGASMPAGADSFNLQYAARTTTCTAISNWLPLGEVGSSTALWRGVNNSPTDGAVLSGDPPTGGDLLIAASNVAGTYQEENPSAATPYTAFPGDKIEYDWVVQHNNADDKTSYCFRMIESTGTEFDTYGTYPVIRTVGYEPLITNWRWYDDASSVTPTTPLALENISPSDVENLNDVKLRLVLKESSGAAGDNIKFAVQYSKFADFSQNVFTVTSTTTCNENSAWCYFNGGGVDNDVLGSTLISDADSCIAGVGAGCGTHNEGVSTTTATLDQSAFSSTEYEFSLQASGPSANTVYYFRLYNITYDEVVDIASSFSYPSLLTEPARLSFSVTGLPSGTSTAGIITDATTTAAAITFGLLPFDADVEVAQRIGISTNAVEGYQVLKYATQQMLNSYGDPVPPITSSNLTPAGWNTACTALVSGCFGYHTTDATLQSGSSRFGPLDSYAAVSTIPVEIMYSSIPTIDVEDVIYKIKVRASQVAGDYETAIVYIAVPVH